MSTSSPAPLVFIASKNIVNLKYFKTFSSCDVILWPRFSPFILSFPIFCVLARAKSVVKGDSEEVARANWGFFLQRMSRARSVRKRVHASGFWSPIVLGLSHRRPGFKRKKLLNWV